MLADLETVDNRRHIHDLNDKHNKSRQTQHIINKEFNMVLAEINIYKLMREINIYKL